jgi:hypothetical protein
LDGNTSLKWWAILFIMLSLNANCMSHNTTGTRRGWDLHTWHKCVHL